MMIVVGYRVIFENCHDEGRVLHKMGLSSCWMKFMNRHSKFGDGLVTVLTVGNKENLAHLKYN